MNRRRRELVTSLLLIGAGQATLWPAVAAGREAKVAAYRRACAELAAERLRHLERWRSGERSDAFLAGCAQRVVAGVMHLAGFWIGTRWGLGLPQIERPGDGRVNCGTFVGRLLVDAGFQVNVRALQMMASALIARTFAPPARMRRFSRVPLPDFIATVLRMQPGLFVIGLDQHVGLLVNLGGEAGLRFVHASYLTETVVDEPAAQALLIRSSRYRVVGKMLGRRNLEQWLRALPIPVHRG
jgi:hypothetical protein